MIGSTRLTIVGNDTVILPAVASKIYVAGIYGGLKLTPVCSTLRKPLLIIFSVIAVVRVFVPAPKITLALLLLDLITLSLTKITRLPLKVIWPTPFSHSKGLPLFKSSYVKELLAPIDDKTLL